MFIAPGSGQTAITMTIMSLLAAMGGLSELNG
jgi:uncharacterized ion transporter superfamily protein YfcC